MNKGALNLRGRKEQAVRNTVKRVAVTEHLECAGLVLTEFPGTPSKRAFQPLYEAEYQTHFTEGPMKAIFPSCPEPKAWPYFCSMAWSFRACLQNAVSLSVAGLI